MLRTRKLVRYVNSLPFRHRRLVSAVIAVLIFPPFAAALHYSEINAWPRSVFYALLVTGVVCMQIWLDCIRREDSE